MDGDRFDELIKRLETGTSRLAQGAGGGIAGGALAMTGKEESDAFVCRGIGVLCAKDAECCSFNCDDDCPSGEICCGSSRTQWGACINDVQC